MSKMLQSSRGMALLAGAGLACFSYLMIRRNRGAKYTGGREEAIKVLKTLRKETFPHLLKFVLLVRSRRGEKSLLRDLCWTFDDGSLSEQEKTNEELFVLVGEELKATEAEIFESFEIHDPEAFKLFCRNTAREDKEIARLAKLIQQGPELAQKGELLPYSEELPLYITEDLVLHCQKVGYLRMLGVWLGSQEDDEGSLWGHRSKRNKGKKKEKGNQKKMDAKEGVTALREQLQKTNYCCLREFGFDASDELHPEQVFREALEHFWVRSSEFGGVLRSMGLLFGRLVVAVGQGKIDSTEFEKDLETLVSFLDRRDELPFAKRSKGLGTIIEANLSAENFSSLIAKSKISFDGENLSWVMRNQSKN